MGSIFVSYSRADLGPVLTLVSALRRAGLETWIDIENLQPGERWKEAIDEALAHASAMVVCLSPLSVESAWTSIELNTALERGIRIIPLMVQRVEHRLLPHSIKERQIVDMEAWPADEAPVYAARAIVAAVGLEPLLPAVELRSNDEACRTILVSLGRRALAEEEIPSLLDIDPDPGPVRPWHIAAISPSILADVLAQARQASRAIVVVGEHADTIAVNVLIGAVAARLGEWRVTVVERLGTTMFRQAAALSRARYVSRPSAAGGRG